MPEGGGKEAVYAIQLSAFFNIFPHCGAGVFSAAPKAEKTVAAGAFLLFLHVLECQICTVNVYLYVYNMAERFVYFKIQQPRKPEEIQNT